MAVSDEYGGPSAEPLLQAAYRVVHRHPGGLEEVARAIGRTPKYLLRAVSGLPGAKLNVGDTMAISAFTKDTEVIEYMASLFGRKLVKLPPPTHGTEDLELIFRDVIRGLGLVLVAATLAPGHEIAVGAAGLAARVGEYLELALPLLSLQTVSLNAMRPLGELYSKSMIDALTGVHEATYLQFRADFLALHAGLQARMRPMSGD